MAPTPHLENARLEALIGAWRTEGEILGDDGATASTVDGVDAYEWLGPFFVVHRAAVTIGEDQIESLEMIGPYDPETGAFGTRAYDNDGHIDDATASVDDAGVWTFGAEGARATLWIDEDRQHMRAEWVRTDDGGDTWRPWMQLRFSRLEPES